MTVSKGLRLNREQIHERIFFYLLILILLTLPFSIQLNSLFIILMVVNWLAAGNLNRKWQTLRYNKMALLYIGLYLMNVVGLLHTFNLPAGLSDVETKLSLMAFPLVLSTSAYINEKKIKWLLICFVIACIGAMLICLGNAIYQYVVINTTDYFFYHMLSSAIGIHAIYLSMYLSFSIFIIVYYLIKNWPLMRLESKIALMGLAVVFFVFILFLSSKLIILASFVFANGFFCRLLLKRTRLIYCILLLFLINAMPVLLISQMPYTKERFRDSWRSSFSFLEKKDYNIEYTGLSLRIVIWKFSVDILNEQNSWLLGVGTGDGQTLLDEAYKRNDLYVGSTTLKDRGYLGNNAHNQYVQFLLSLGIIGLAYFIICLLASVVLAIRTGNYFYLSFILFFAACALTESNLCTQKGVVFFSLFNSLFIFHIVDSTYNVKQVKC